MSPPGPDPPSSPHSDVQPGSFPGLAALAKLLCVMVIVAVMMGIAVPQFLRVEDLGYRTRALAQAKGIGLTLKIYASDHESIYPTGTNSFGERIQSANDAFRSLFPEYVASETLFGNERSAYQRGGGPDNRIAPRSEILRPGENVYSYVMGLNDVMNPTLPLIADGTDGSGAGTYVSDPHALGGVWKGEAAIVIRLDNSGVVEHLSGPPEVRTIPQKFSDGTRRHLLSPAALGKGLKLLDPGVTPAPSASPSPPRSGSSPR